MQKKSPIGLALTAVLCFAAAPVLPKDAFAQTGISPPPAEGARIIDLGAAQAGGSGRGQGATNSPVTQRGVGQTGAGVNPLVIGEVQEKWAEIVQPSPQPLLRVPEDGKIYAVRVRTTMETMFVAPAHDPIADFYLADATVFNPGYSRLRPNVLRVRATHIDADTTLHLITKSGRFFHFYLEARGPAFAEVPNVAVYLGSGAASMSDMAPQTGSADPAVSEELGLEGAVRTALADRRRQVDMSDQPAGIQAGGGTQIVETGASTSTNYVPQPDYLRNIPFDPRKMRFDDYTVYIQTEESREIAPVNVMHDGITTYLYFGEKSDYIEHPTIRQVVDEIDTPVTYNVLGEKSDIYAVHAIGSFTLRVGGKIVCVVYTGPDLFGPEQKEIRVVGPEGGVPRSTNPVGPDTDREAPTDTHPLDSSAADAQREPPDAPQTVPPPSAGQATNLDTSAIGDTGPVTAQGPQPTLGPPIPDDTIRIAGDSEPDLPPVRRPEAGR
ncbi:MAG: TrbG/VirB9 family P-type conjugative transfer protein [Alphaproteobacteria bacterium]